jgi:hypothetical protein
VPDEPHLVPGSKDSKEATNKRKSDVVVRTAGKHAKAFSRTAVPLKVPITSKSVGVASPKVAVVKAAPTISLLKASVAPTTNVP